MVDLLTVGDGPDECRADEGTVVLRVVGALDAAEVAPQVRQARSALRAPGVQLLAVDLAAVTTVDSAGLGVLAELRQVAEDRGAGFELRAVPPRVAQLLQLTGMLDSLPAQ